MLQVLYMFRYIRQSWYIMIIKTDPLSFYPTTTYTACSRHLAGKKHFLIYNFSDRYAFCVIFRILMSASVHGKLFKAIRVSLNNCQITWLTGNVASTELNHCCSSLQSTYCPVVCLMNLCCWRHLRIRCREVARVRCWLQHHVRQRVGLTPSDVIYIHCDSKKIISTFILAVTYASVVRLWNLVILVEMLL